MCVTWKSYFIGICRLTAGSTTRFDPERMTEFTYNLYFNILEAWRKMKIDRNIQPADCYQ
jgi:hypothetical protein